jgi:hypothetical protein
MVRMPDVARELMIIWLIDAPIMHMTGQELLSHGRCLVHLMRTARYIHMVWTRFCLATLHGAFLDLTIRDLQQHVIRLSAQNRRLRSALRAIPPYILSDYTGSETDDLPASE